jgi:hypothetical protein
VALQRSLTVVPVIGPFTFSVPASERSVVPSRVMAPVSVLLPDTLTIAPL